MHCSIIPLFLLTLRVIVHSPKLKLSCLVTSKGSEITGLGGTGLATGAEFEQSTHLWTT